MVIFVLSLVQEELGLWEFMLQKHAGFKTYLANCTDWNSFWKICSIHFKQAWLEHLEGEMLFGRFKSVI